MPRSTGSRQREAWSQVEFSGPGARGDAAAIHVAIDPVADKRGLCTVRAVYVVKDVGIFGVDL